MSQEKRNAAGEEHWWVMFKSLAFVYGVPIGITLGAISGSIFEVRDNAHSAALGLLIGFGSAVLFGGGIGAWAARGKYKWLHLEFPLVPGTWDALVMALNVKAARKHYLMVRRDEKDYIAYAPTLVRPVAAGPLTVSGEYLSVVVARVNDTTLTITGPRYMVGAFETAATKAGAIAAAEGS